MDANILTHFILLTTFTWYLCVSRTKSIAVLPADFHPGRVLSSASHNAPSSDITQRKQPPRVIKEDQVMYHFYRNGKNRKDYRKPSTKFMVTLFNDLQNGGKLRHGSTNSDHTDVIRSFSGNNILSKKTTNSLTEFYIPYLPPHERLKTAEIRFLRHVKDRPKLQPLKVRIIIKKNSKVLKKVIIRERPLIQKEHDVIDVSSFISPWINSFHGNISLIIRIPDWQLNKTSEDATSRNLSQSLIVLYLQDGEFLANMYSSFTESSDTTVKLSRRKRRDATKRSDNSTSVSDMRIKRDRGDKRWNRPGKKDACQLNNFEVDFNVIGWGQWIIHPKKYNAKFCFGTCPSPIDAKFKPTNHAMLQTLMRMKRPNSAPVPCCVPTRLNPLSMMYFEYDELVVRHHEDMIAEECGCR